LLWSPLSKTVRLDLRNPAFAGIFQYITAIDPAPYGHPQSETRIKGRINVNTAPSFRDCPIAWMQLGIAQAIVTYRDNLAGPFESIAALCQVPEMGYYATDPQYASVDLTSGPT